MANCYAIVEIETNLVNSLLSWENQKIDESYPIQDGHYIIELDETDFAIMQQDILLGKRVKITNRDESILLTDFEEVPKTLEELKSEKIAKLSKDCNQTILGRFSHDFNGSIYYFSNDMEAQANFDKADRAFEKGRITEVVWTAYDANGQVVRLPIDATLFEPLYISHLTHVQSNIARFRDYLMPLVEGALTPEELEQINW